MKKIVPALFAILLLIAPVMARAFEPTTTAMYYSLQSMSSPDYAFWQGYVAGASMSYFNYVSEKNHGCTVPHGLTIGQEVQITLNYLKNNPEVWQLDPSMLIWIALNRDFCPGN